MGLHKICTHKGRARDRCEHAWWGSFRGKRVSLPKWTNREIGSKAEADIALAELRAAIRDGTFDERGLDPPADNSPLTFGKFAEIYKQRHVLAKGLALSSTIDGEEDASGVRHGRPTFARGTDAERATVGILRVSHERRMVPVRGIEPRFRG